VSLIDLDGQPDAPSIPSADVEYASYVDYFGFDETKKYYLDARFYIEFKPMTEGQRAKYESATSRDIRFNRRTDDAAIKMDAPSDRRALIEASVIGWNLMRPNANGTWEPITFSKGTGGSTLSLWLDKTNPKFVNGLVAEIRKSNEWMTEDMTSEMIREEIGRLQEMLVQTEEREARQKNS
jgi:hypothetical protein